MNVKKWIVLLLSGTLVSAMLLGCSQTTVDHHFFTDTQIETEHTTEIVEQAIAPKMKELQEILGDDLKLEVMLQSNGIAALVPGTGLPEDLTDEFVKASLETVVSSETLTASINENSGNVFYIFCCGGPFDEKVGLKDFMSGTENAIDQLCEAFSGVDDESLTLLKTALETGLNDTLTLTITGLHYSVDDKYYIVAVMMPSSGGILEWK